MCLVNLKKFIETKYLNLNIMRIEIIYQWEVDLGFRGRCQDWQHIICTIVLYLVFIGNVPNCLLRFYLPLSPALSFLVSQRLIAFRATAYIPADFPFPATIKTFNKLKVLIDFFFLENSLKYSNENQKNNDNSDKN